MLIVHCILITSDSIIQITSQTLVDSLHTMEPIIDWSLFIRVFLKGANLGEPLTSGAKIERAFKQYKRWKFNFSKQA